MNATPFPDGGHHVEADDGDQRNEAVARSTFLSDRCGQCLPRGTGVGSRRMSDYGKKTAVHRRGSDPFRHGTKPRDFDLEGFWRWTGSDLLSNATRGVLAEYLVARALGIDVSTGVRDEWGAYDLCSPEGVKVEVKSSAYLQSWHQRGPSAVSFSVRKTRAIDPNTNAVDIAMRRQADVYVFALLAHTDKATVEPMDLAQWQFYVVPTFKLDGRARSQHSISLRSLEAMAPTLQFDALRDAVAGAFKEQLRANVPESPG